MEQRSAPPVIFTNSTDSESSSNDSEQSSSSESSSDPYSSTSDDDYQIRARQMIQNTENNTTQLKPENTNNNLPSPEDQLKIINELKEQNQELKIGEDVYVISDDFITQWEYYVEGTSSTLPPSPIPAPEYYDKERKGLTHSYNDTYLTKPVWDKFKEWYGGEDCPLQVIAGKNGQPYVLLEVRQATVHYKEEEKNMFFRVDETVGDFKKRALKLFDVKFTETTENRLSSSSSSSDDEKKKGIEIDQVELSSSNSTDNEEEKNSKESKQVDDDSNPYANDNENSSPYDWIEDNPKSPESPEVLNNLSDPQENKTEDTEKIPSFSDFRICDYYTKNNPKPLEDKETMGDANIIDTNDLILDYKKDDNTWYSDDLQTSNSMINYHTSITSYNDPYYNRYSGYSSYNQNYGTPLGPGKVGFQNLGNTCFFNSGVQCLMHSKPLVKALLDPSWENDINETNPLGMHGKLVRAFQSLLKEMWNPEYRVLSPSELKQVVGEFATQFSGWGQQDSHELITFMLDGIHEDLNRCRTKPLVDTVIGDGTNDETTAETAWENHKKRNDSIIVDHFHGQLRSVLQCPSCHKTTVVFDPYMTLSLPISKPNAKELSVIFIPSDFMQPWQGLNIIVPPMPTDEQCSKAISKALNKEVNVVMASLSSYGRKISWGIEESSSYYKPKILAFELNNDDNIVNVLCCFNIKLTNQYYQSYANYESVGTPFLLPIPKDIVTTEDKAQFMAFEAKDELINTQTEKIEEITKEYFGNIIWNPPNAPQPSEAMLQKIHLIASNDEGKVPEGHDFGIEISSDYYYSKSPLIISPTNEKLTKNTIMFYISDEKLKPESGFSYPSLVRHEIELEASNSDSDNEQSVTLMKCFDYFSTEEVLDEDNQWFCPHCRQFVCAKKKMDLWSTPQCLVIHLKRFSQGRYTSQKDERLVDFPDEIDIGQYITGPKTLSTKYRLYAVDEHMGGMGGGHYTAHCIVTDLNSNKGEWYSFNDSSCSSANSSEAHSSSAYVLFYQRIDDECPVIEQSTKLSSFYDSNQNSTDSPSD